MGGGRRRDHRNRLCAAGRECRAAGEWKNRRRRAQFSYSRRTVRSRRVRNRSRFVRVISDRPFRRLLRASLVQSPELIPDRVSSWTLKRFPPSSARVFRSFRVVRNGKPWKSSSAPADERCSADDRLGYDIVTANTSTVYRVRYPATDVTPSVSTRQFCLFLVPIYTRRPVRNHRQKQWDANPSHDSFRLRFGNIFKPSEKLRRIVTVVDGNDKLKTESISLSRTVRFRRLIRTKCRWNIQSRFVNSFSVIQL